MGITPAGPFDVPEAQAIEWLTSPNPTGRPNSDVLRPYFNGNDLTKRPRNVWTIDFGIEMPLEQASRYEKPFGYLESQVKPVRLTNRRAAYAKNWWIYAESRPAMRQAFAVRSRFLATCMVAKHRMFLWLDAVALPANVVIVFGRSDDFFLGILHCRFHEVWALRQGTRLETRPRYTPTTCFETFPFPFSDDLQPQWDAPSEPPLKLRHPPEPDRSYAENLAAKNYFMGKEEPPSYGRNSQRAEAKPFPPALATPLSAPEHRAAIAAAAKELNDLREDWLNPPELTVERILEFPGSVDGPWGRYIDPASIDDVEVVPTVPDAAPLLVGTVKFPRIEPRDADCAAKLKQRTLTNLYNERPTWLDLAHKKIDAAVAAAYGWPADLTDEQILEKASGAEPGAGRRGSESGQGKEAQNRALKARGRIDLANVTHHLSRVISLWV